MKTNTEALEKFRQRHLKYAVGNILKDCVTMGPILGFAVLYNHEITWQGVLYVIVATIGYSLFTTSLHRYLHRKDKLHIPPEPKYSTKTYQEHKADREAKHKD
jgi:hypothetical protein